MLSLVQIKWWNLFWFCTALLCAYAPLSYSFLFGANALDVFLVSAVALGLATAITLYAFPSNVLWNKYWMLVTVAFTAHLISGFSFCIPEISVYPNLQSVGGLSLFFIFIALLILYENIQDLQNTPAP